MFNIDEFGKIFKTTINWMLDNEHGREIKDSIKSFIDYRDGLKNDPNYVGAFKYLMEAIVTNSWYREKPKNFDAKMDEFLKKYGNSFKFSQMKEEIIELVGERNCKKIELLSEYETVRDFTEDLYECAKAGETKVLGIKGRDDYLRSVGYWDRIPMDMHEKRFILRTGIYHVYAPKDNSDPLEQSHLQKALTSFCKKWLSGFIIKVVEEIDLGEAPGIVDVFIWNYCAKKRYNICGRKPHCEKCYLREACLYATINLSLQNEK